MLNKTRLVLSSSIACAVGLGVYPVYAQNMLEEVVVTARKREESVLKVPVVASVLSGETLDRYGLSDVGQISDRVPGLNFGTGVVAAGVQVSLRGIGTSTLNATIDQSVALNVDGLQLTQGLAFAAATFDMAGVQVYKGPQALFFGKAAPAGVIAIQTADPTDEFEAIVRGGYEFEAEEKLGELILSGPVTDTLGLRLAAQFTDSGGYFENTAQVQSHPIFGNLGGLNPTYRDYPDEKNTLVRGTALWEPNDRFNAKLKVNYTDQDSQGSAHDAQLSSCPDGTDSAVGGLLGLNFIAGYPCKLDRKIAFSYADPAAFPGVWNGGAPFSKAEQVFGSLELNYQLGDDLTLTSVTGSYDIDQESLLNGATTPNYGPPFMSQNKFTRNDFTQELRLTSDFDSAVNFLLGGFYQKGDMGFLVDLPFNQAYVPLTGINTEKFVWGDHDIDIEAYSLFGQVLWHILPDLELGAGVRWTTEGRTHKVTDLLPTLSGMPSTPVPLGNPTIGSNNWAPELTLTWSPTDDLTVFGALKQAYKSGSFNTAGVPVPWQDTSFGDEKVRGGELGLKTRLFDDTLAFNAATYYYRFEDLQVDSNEFDAVSRQFLAKTVNAAEAEVYGIDIDARYSVPAIDGLILSGALNWNKAEYRSFDNALCWGGQTIAQGCDVPGSYNEFANVNILAVPPEYFPGYTRQDLAGEPLVRAPEWTANVSLDYEHAVFDGMTLRFGVNANYSSSYLTALQNRKDMYQDSYVKTSANISLSGVDDGWMVELIGDNLTDEIVTGNCISSPYADAQLFGNTYTGSTLTGISGVDELACFAERGRSVWMRLTVRPAVLFSRSR